MKIITVKRSANYLKFNGISCSMGNHKLDKSTLIFNLPAVKTCPNCNDCKSTCFAIRSERFRPVVKTCRENNYQASLLSNFADTMSLIIERGLKSGIRAVRIHESGDFYSQAYADKWTELAAAFPHITFFAYTKSPYRPTGDNINIVESILPDGSINYGDRETVYKLAKKFHAKVCPYGLTKDHSWKCGRECTACQRAKHVLFIKH